MAVNYTIEQHAVAFPSKVLAREGGKHIYNIQLSTAADNGNLIKKGAYKSLDLYAEAAATTFTATVLEQAPNGNWYVEVTDPGDALLVYEKPMIAEEYNNRFKAESNFYNAAGDVVRAYELAVGDVFEASAKAFSKAPTKGASVTGVASKKMTIA